MNDKQKAGKIGGNARAASLSPERRSEIARLGSTARHLMRLALDTNLVSAKHSCDDNEVEPLPSRDADSLDVVPAQPARHRIER